MSIDGFVTGPGQSAQDPIGKGGERSADQSIDARITGRNKLGGETWSG
ncbi:hypothetical protein AB0I53_06470 [Saccharopolyspora sp. NPDC050389]